MKNLMIILVFMAAISILNGQTIWDEDYSVIATDGDDNDNFGTSVSVYDDYAVVGAPGHDDPTNGTNSGAAYVYVYDPINDEWDFDEKLTPSDGNANDEFGRQVCVYKDYIIVGAHNHTHDGLTQAGAAYFYHKNPLTGEWDEQILVAGDAASNDHYGRAVSIYGSRAIVGALDEDTQGNNAGAAYTYYLNGSGEWVFDTQIFGSTIGAGDNFGQSVCVFGNYVAIGAMYDDDQAYNAGAAYVFQRTIFGWVQQSKLYASDPQSSDWFGHAVSITNDHLVVGAMMEDAAGTNAGAAYTYKRSDLSWNFVNKLVPTLASSEDRFGGGNVGIAGNFLVVGSYGNNTTYSDAGLGYLYEYDTDEEEWVLKNYLQSDNVATEDWFARTIAMSPYFIISGASQDDNINGTNAGEAYIFVSPVGSKSIFVDEMFNEEIDKEVNKKALEEATINIYPNPVRQGITTASDTYIHVVEVFDLSGKIIKKTIVNGHNCEMNLADIKSGIYTIIVHTENGIYPFKIIKE